MEKRKNWFKRLFVLNYDVQIDEVSESITDILDLIEIQEIHLDDTHTKLSGLAHEMSVVVKRIDTVEDKVNAINTFDYNGRVLYAQADLNMKAANNSQIIVSIDNTRKSAFLRFGSSEAVDTVDAVWFISKTGNKVQNDFGDALAPSAPRLTVQNFLKMTQDKQGLTPLSDLVPPHTHDIYEEEIDANATAIEQNAYAIEGVYRNLTSFAEVINANKANIATNTAAIEVNESVIEVNEAGIGANSAAIAANYVRCEVNEAATIDNSLAIAVLDVRVDDIEAYLGAVEVEVSLGTGNYTYDSQVPPKSAHFATLGNSGFVEGEYEFWISNTDSRTNDLSQWSRARVGDKLSIFNSNQNKAKYTIEFINFDAIYDAWNVKAKFVKGTGGLQYGTSYDLNITRVYNSFEPEALLDDRIEIQQKQIDALLETVQEMKVSMAIT